MKTVDSRCWYCVLRVRRESEHCSNGHNCLVATVNSAKCLPYHHLEPRVQVAERCWPVWKSRPGPIKLSVQDLYERVTKFRFVPAMPASTFYLFVSLFVLDFIIPLFYFTYFFLWGLLYCHGSFHPCGFFPSPMTRFFTAYALECLFRYQGVRSLTLWLNILVLAAIFVSPFGSLSAYFTCSPRLVSPLILKCASYSLHSLRLCGLPL